MLLSMTGHGQAQLQNDQRRVIAEVRSVNNRFLKTHLGCELDVNHQAKLEALLKQFVRRGSVYLVVKVRELDPSKTYRLNAPVLQAYWLQLSEIAESSQSINVESLLQLPGVVDEPIAGEDSETLWPDVKKVVTEALEKLLAMRASEGATMQADMKKNLATIRQSLQHVETLAPTVVENYAKKTIERIQNLLEKFDIATQPGDIIREVGLFADRVDISEEIVRLQSHLTQFDQIMESETSSGKQLDFLVQEMLRETNTIGSKASNAQIANHVVSIKTAIERIREMVQNIE